MPVESTLHLVAIEGPAAGTSVSLDSEIVIGRADVDVVIDDPEIVPEHAALRPTADGLEIEDLGSPIGTFVNERKIESPTKLRVGDQIKIGRSVFEIQLLAGTGDDPADRVPHAYEVVDALSALVRDAEEKEQAAKETQAAKERAEREAAARRAEEKEAAKEAKRAQKGRAKEAKVEEKRLAQEAKAEEKRRAEEAKVEEQRRAEEAKAEEQRRAQEAKQEQMTLAPTRPPEEVEPSEVPDRPIPTRALEIPESGEERRAPKRSRRGVGVVAIVAVAAAAVGIYIVASNGPTREGFISEVRDVCAGSGPERRPLRAINPGRLEALGDGIADALRHRLEVLSMIRGLDRPEDLDPELPRFLSAFRKTNRALDDLGQAVVLGGKREVSSSRSDLLRRAQTERKAARNLGTPECGGLGIV